MPKPPIHIKKALAIRQDLHRLNIMGWPDKIKEEYIMKEYAPNLYIIHLSMLADEYIEEITRPKTENYYGRQNSGRT